MKLFFKGWKKNNTVIKKGSKIKKKYLPTSESRIFSISFTCKNVSPSKLVNAFERTCVRQ